jgi:hypothetical protein
MRLGPFVAATALSNFGISCAYSAIGAYSFNVNSFLWTFAAAIIVPGAAMAVARFAFR